MAAVHALSGFMDVTCFIKYSQSCFAAMAQSVCLFVEH